MKAQPMVKNVQSRKFFRVLCLLIVVAATALGFQNETWAQFLPGASGGESKQTSTAESLVREAEKDGSTVIIIKPGGSASQPDASTMDNMRAERFLKARERIREIVSSGPTLINNIIGTLKAASPDGTYFWLWRALGTALLGVLCAVFVTSRVFRWMDKNTTWIQATDPRNTADKVRYLLVRTFLSIILISLAFFVAIAVALILDPGHEPSRRLIFEIILANTVYRFLRHGVSWNLFAGAMPKHRLVNLTDDQAIKIHRDFHIGVLVLVALAAAARFISFTGEDQIAAGVTGGVTADNIELLQLWSALFATLALALYTVRNWKAWQHVFAPRDPSAVFYKLRTALARLVPIVSLFYGIFAFVMFTFRLALGLPAPGLVIAAPFLIFYIAVLAYAVAILIIQAFYDRRLRRFEERVAEARAAHEAQVEELDIEGGEVMITSPTETTFEFQPVFRSFFEGAALTIVVTVALGELGRVWGIEVGREGNAWAAFLDIGLAAILCWLAYRSVNVFIDKRIEEEGGVPEGEEEIGGEGGGAGATRMATLLPIMRYVMVITLFSIAGMVILSRMGFDIGPIFAGAGVVGIAVGFGAQTLIRDIFSGAFFLMDDAFRKGEYVDIEGVKGTVEKISIRSFQLRHHLGALHTIPFGEIKQLTNYSRDWVLMKLPLRVTYDTDVEKVRKLVKKLGQQLLEHPQVGHTFMQPLKSQGVYKMEDSAMIIRVKFMTKPGEQFVTRKVVYESIQDLFAREGIHFAHKEVTVRLAEGNTDDLSEEEQKAVTAAARSVIDAEEEAKAGGKVSAGGDR